ncbi:MAG: hypothetical protein AB1700_01950 [Bacillota bacterium]
MAGVLMTVDGFPIAHEVFPGNTAEVETFTTISFSIPSSSKR